MMARYDRESGPPEQVLTRDLRNVRFPPDRAAGRLCKEAA